MIDLDLDPDKLTADEFEAQLDRLRARFYARLCARLEAEVAEVRARRAEATTVRAEATPPSAPTNPRLLRGAYNGLLVWARAAKKRGAKLALIEDFLRELETRKRIDGIEAAVLWGQNRRDQLRAVVR